MPYSRMPSMLVGKRVNASEHNDYFVNGDNFVIRVHKKYPPKG